MTRLIPLLLLTIHIGCIDADAPLKPGGGDELIFTIEQGSTAQGLYDDLSAIGMTQSKWKYKLALRDLDAGCIKAGQFRINPTMSLREIFKTFCGAPQPEDVPFVVVEGNRINDTDRALAQANLIPAGEYASLASSKEVDLPFPVEGGTLEGYLYPETYGIIPETLSAKGFIERQLKMFKDRFLDPHSGDFDKRTLHEVVVMASMLEREEPNVENRRVVAGIIWKRLDHAWPLGIDATSHYKLKQWNDRRGLLSALRNKSDPYNTRLRKGLPPTAIGNPGINSLEAALNPIETPYWYYLHDGKGVFRGAKNGAEHERNRAKYNVY